MKQNFGNEQRKVVFTARYKFWKNVTVGIAAKNIQDICIKIMQFELLKNNLQNLDVVISTLTTSHAVVDLLA